MLVDKNRPHGPRCITILIVGTPISRDSKKDTLMVLRGVFLDVGSHMVDAFESRIGGLRFKASGLDLDA